MPYQENPKTKGSGIVCCIPQKGGCPNGCRDCFFQSGRSYLEPLDKNLPNMPSFEEVGDRIVRVNDGNDSNNQKQLVIKATNGYRHRFFNTAIPDLDFPAPVVLTINPGDITDESFYKVAPTNNLMFVRFRANVWNVHLAQQAVEFYTKKEVPVVMTFMAYHNESDIPEAYRRYYLLRIRTENEYYAINTASWRVYMSLWAENPYVYSCGKVEGEKGKGGCARCGNCLREYFNAIERMK